MAACLREAHMTVAGLATMAMRTERPLMVARDRATSPEFGS